MNGTLTRLKKYNRPSQVTPPRKCSQRNSMRRLVLKSVGTLISVKLSSYSENPVLEVTIVDGWQGKGNTVDPPGPGCGLNFLVVW
jgi:hypothetical protein